LFGYRRFHFWRWWVEEGILGAGSFVVARCAVIRNCGGKFGRGRVAGNLSDRILYGSGAIEQRPRESNPAAGWRGSDRSARSALRQFVNIIILYFYLTVKG
jgi:hypothetical protein